MSLATIQWIRGRIRLVDQRKLPARLVFIECRKLSQLWSAIKTLAVRGAPALGAAAGFGVLLAASGIKARDRKAFDRKLKRACAYLGSSRPTAVNLFAALERMEGVLRCNPKASVTQIKSFLRKEAMAIFEEDRQVCRAMGRHGAALIKNGFRILTICNAGALATVDFGTALGVMYTAKQKGRRFKVFACETRPLLQGARLTAWELKRVKIDTTLICDNMAATLMAQGKVDIILTGADRIAANGDAANKIGTYNLAVLARHHHVPFYVVAPKTTFDLGIASGREIPIEERSPDEILSFAGTRIAPVGTKAYNPAFDVTPHGLIAGIVTEKGIIRPPFSKNIRRILGKNAR